MDSQGPQETDQGIMTTIPLITASGDASGTVEIAEDLMCRGASRRLVHEAVVMHCANQRAGSANTKTKSEVTASNKKPWRQKGSGRARAGYQSSPIWRGGGVAFGPKPRSYRKKMTRKAMRKAFALALADKIDQGAVTVVESLRLDEPKTKRLAGLLKTLGMDGRGLVLVADLDRNLRLASRNLDRIQLMAASDVNTYEVMRHSRILMTRDALAVVEGRLRRATGGRDR